MKAYTTDIEGKLYAEMSQEEIIANCEALKAEKFQSWFWKEGLRYQKKHNATIAYLESLITKN